MNEKVRTILLPPMRACLVVGVLLLTAAICEAQIPRQLNYQGKLANPQGVAVPDATYAMVFKLFTLPAAPTPADVPLWTEPQMVPVRDGIFSVALGAVSPFPANLDFLGQYYLEIKVNSDPALPRHQLIGAGYALGAVRAGPASVDSASIADGSINANHIRTAAVTGADVKTASLLPDDRRATVSRLNCPSPLPNTGQGAPVAVCTAFPSVSEATQALIIVRLDQESACAAVSGKSARLETRVGLTYSGATAAEGTVGTSLGAGRTATDSLNLVQMVRIEPGASPLAVSASWSNISASCTNGAAMSWKNISVSVAYLGYAQ